MDKIDSRSAAKVIAIPTAFILSGYGTSFSQNSVPHLYEQPASVSIRILRGTYWYGAFFMVPGSIISASAFAFLAYSARSKMERNLYTLAGGLMLSPQAWTMGVMYPGMERMFAIWWNADALQRADESGEVTSLLKAWVAQNWVRAFATFAGGVLGVYAQLY